MSKHLLRQPIECINMGLRGFTEPLVRMNVRVVQVNWRPKPRRSERIELLLSQLVQKK